MARTSTPSARGRLRTKDNVVSIWLGTMPSSEALEVYMDEGDAGVSPFARDLRASVARVEMIESSVSDTGGAAEVLEGHIGASQYGEAAAEAAAKLGLGQVNSAVVMIDWQYTPPAGATFADGKLTFVGVFEYDVDA